MITQVNLKTGDVTQRPLTEAEVAALPVKTEEDIEREARELFKQDRETNVASIKVTVDNMVFDGDEVSQTRMAKTIVAMEDNETTLWVLADNTQIQATKAQLKQALRLAGEEQTRLWT